MSNTKPSQILIIEPMQELVFKGPFTDVVTSQLKLTNPADRPVCFKVKTTAPKQYCVRPNSGLIPPKGVVNVSIMLQPFDYIAEEKNKHKFMVQTTFVPEGETSLDNIWKNTLSSELMDSKLRVLFEMPDANNFDKSSTKQTPQKSANASTEAELRRALDENKRLQSQLQQLEQENVMLQDRLRHERPAHFPGGVGKESAIGTVSADFKILHVVIVALVALFLGLIFGKVF